MRFLFIFWRFLICMNLFKSKKMSIICKIENTQDENLEDFFMIVKKNMSRYFVEIENSVPYF